MDPEAPMVQKRKWIRKKGVKKNGGTQLKAQNMIIMKRQLVNVMITKGSIDDCGGSEKKRKQDGFVEG